VGNISLYLCSEIISDIHEYLAYTFVSGLNSGLGYVLNRMALTGRIKKGWCNLLQVKISKKKS
jgi:hypothetical protein